MAVDQPSLETILFASARASVRFACRCLEPYQNHLRAKSSFVDPTGEIMHWHEFGDLEGPGWAANAVGGALLLYRWGLYASDPVLTAKAEALLDHVLEDGFIDEKTGFIYPYFELAEKRFCLNYTHNDNWLCPGSLAKIGSQLLEFGDLLPDSPKKDKMIGAAGRLADWLYSHTPILPNGWLPRRITLAGAAYPQSPTGGPDPIFDHSADGLYLLELYGELSARGLGSFDLQAQELGDAFIKAGGWWGSINHDTYDDHENVAFSVAYRVFSRCAVTFSRPDWRRFAREIALPALAGFQMLEDRQGVATRGLLWMEESWDTAYLWENAEAAQAYLEDWAANGNEQHRQTGLGILRAIANHHYGLEGFLTEGVDWNNHVSRRHHVHEELYGAINYTEPLLNHLHLLGPTLFYFEQTDFRFPTEVHDSAAISLVNQLRIKRMHPQSGAEGARYLVRLYYPAVETDQRLEQALDFVRRSGADGVLLFEASYDMDPALIEMAELEKRFDRLKAVASRFQDISVREKPVEVHINIMITLGHVDAGSARPDNFPFQFLVDENGVVSRSTACPLDPVFLARIEKIYRLAAMCKVAAVWVDDDTRLLLHDLPGMACFCPRHIEAISKKTGYAWTQPELIEELRSERGKVGGDASSRYSGARPLRAVWLDVQEEALLNLAEVVERAVHETAPTTRVGLMTVGTAVHSAEGRHTDRFLRTLAGATRPLIRPGSGYWSDWYPAAVVEKVEDCARQISFLGPDVQAVAEVENHPYSPFLKSNRLLALELALDVLAGMPDLSLNLLTSMSGRGPLEPEGTDYAGLLSYQRPFLDALAREWAGRVRRGIGVACSEDTARWMKSSKHTLADWIEPRPWEPLLARLGFPIGRPDQGPHWITGDTARALTRGDWNQYLKDGAVLDPGAVQVIIELGMGEDFGVRAVRSVGDAVNEEFSAISLNGSFAGHILPVYNHIPFQNLYTWDLTAEAGTVLSVWMNVDGQEAGSATVLLESKDGRRIGLLPYSLPGSTGVLLNLAHRHQWVEILEWVARSPLVGRVTQGINIYPMIFFRPEDQSLLAAVANLSADRVIGGRLRFAKQFHSAEKLNERGTWVEDPYAGEKELVLEIDAFSLAVWRLKR